MTALTLDRRGALVLGGGGGIGAAVCASLVDAGAVVTAADRAGQAGPLGTGTVACDATSAAGIEGAVEAAAARAGRLDIVVHCAGIARDALLAKMRDEEWRDVLAANLDSAFYLVRSAIPRLRAAGGGAIVLVSSINGERGKMGQANYAASKAGLNALARTAARELGRFNIRVNVVSPGWTDTPMTARLAGELRDRALGETSLGRVAEPRDIAGPVLFLCSDLSRHITGQVLRVDGGQLIG